MDDLTDTRHISRLEIVDTGRRRRWSAADKLRIVEESFSAPRLASAPARRMRDTKAPPTSALFRPHARQRRRRVEQPFQIGRVASAAPNTRDQLGQRFLVLA